jgi:site-specific DNA-methyltransferase (adenine-specific)
MEMQTLINGECLECMSRIPDHSVDMILCDLPYGTTRNAWDAIIPFEAMWSQYWRITKTNAAIVLFAQPPFDKKLAFSCLDFFRYEWIWQKTRSTGFLNSKRQPLRAHENILVFYKNKCNYIPQMTPCKPYKSKISSKNISSKNYGGGGAVEPFLRVYDKRYPSSVLMFPHDKHHIHPTQKPIRLLEYLIATYTYEGMTVLDNCMGSGSTGVACKNLNRNFIGIERDINYFELARNRIESHIVEADLPQKIS